MKAKLWRKGQGAMEYMFTHAWAILAVLIVGLALWQLGVFKGLSGNAPAPSQVMIIDSTLHTDGDLEISVVNYAGQPISITDAYCTSGGANGTALGTPYRGETNTNSINNNNFLRIGAGESSNIRIAGCTDKGEYTAGNSYRIDVTIYYTADLTNLEHRSESHVAGTVISP